jgi:hypothetical protein
LPLLEIPDPVTVAFIGYWLSPITILIKAIASFTPPQRKPLVEQVLVLTDLGIGGVCFSIWVVAIALGEGRFLPASPTGMDLVAGASGLAVYLAAIAYALLAYGLGRKLDAEVWLSRWAGLGVIVGVVVWAWDAGLN